LERFGLLSHHQPSSIRIVTKMVIMKAKVKEKKSFC